VSKVTIDLNDDDPAEMALMGDVLEALATYRRDRDDPTKREEGEEEALPGGAPETVIPAAEGLKPGDTLVVAATTSQKRRRRKKGTVDPTTLNPDLEPPLPLTSTAAGKPLADDAQAVAAAVIGEIVILDSSGTPKASYPTPEKAAEALIEILKAAPSKDSLDNLLTVNSSTLGRLGKESDRVIAAYGDLTAKLKTATVTVVAPQPVAENSVDKLLQEIGDSTKPPSAAAPGPLPVIVGPMPPADKLVQSCGDLLQAYARDKGAGFVGALNLLTKEFGVDNIKKIDADKLPALYNRLAELVQAP